MHGGGDIDIKKLVAGDKAEWDAFVEQYSALIYSAIRKIFLSYLKEAKEWDVNEAFQEVFVRLIKDDYHLLKIYNPAKAALSTWLVIVTRSTTIDFLRKAPSQDEPLENIKIPLAADANKILPATDIPKHLLSGRQRLVLEMLFERGLSVTEAAQILGVNEQTIRSTKHKAISRLRRYFAKKA